LHQFLTELPALLGVVVGALASYLATNAGARSQWIRSQHVRWEEKRVEVYAEYAHAVKTVYELSKRVAATRGFQTTTAPLPLSPGLEDLMHATIERSQVWERLLLLGEPDVVAAAKTWHRAVRRLEEYANGVVTDPNRWRPAVRAADHARSLFYASARRDLGIGDTSLPKGGADKGRATSATSAPETTSMTA
jgi:hypothetical protein